MTIRELDRLVTKTDINDMSKRALRSVRTAILAGKNMALNLDSSKWSVAFENEYGNEMKVSFSFRKEAI